MTQKAALRMAPAPALTRSEKKRRQILDAGRELFLAQGFAATSMDQVTARSGVSKATVYNHFPSKEALFEAAVRTRAEEVFAALPVLDAVTRSPDEMLTDYFHTLLGILLSQDGIGMCFLLMSEGRRFPENARLIYETGFGRGVGEMTAYLTHLSESGRLRVSDPGWAATRLLGLMMPPLPMMCAGIQAPDLPDRAEIGRCVTLFLGGISAA